MSITGRVVSSVWYFGPPPPCIIAVSQTLPSLAVVCVHISLARRCWVQTSLVNKGLPILRGAQGRCIGIGQSACESVKGFVLRALSRATLWPPLAFRVYIRRAAGGSPWRSLICSRSGLRSAIGSKSAWFVISGSTSVLLSHIIHLLYCY